MREPISILIDRVKRPNRRARFIAWLKDISDIISELDRPINYIIKGRPLVRGVVGIVVGVFLIALPWIIAGMFTQTKSDQITLFSASSSIILTLGLIWIYLSIAESEHTQAKFIKQQTDLQEDIQSLQKDQVAIMGAEFQPVIEVLDYGVGDAKPPTSPVSLPDGPPHGGDFLRIKMSNLSNAIATNLRLRFILDYRETGLHAGGTDIPLSRVNRASTWASKPGGIIQGNETEVEFHCIAGLILPRVGRGDILPFHYCLSNLSDNGVTHLRIGMILVYEDRKGKEHEIELEGLELTSSNYPDSPTLARVRSAAKEIPIDLVREGLLSDGISMIPPKYRS